MRCTEPLPVNLRLSLFILSSQGILVRFRGEDGGGSFRESESFSAKFAVSEHFRFL